MSPANLRTVTLPAPPGKRPADDELDLFGLTHPGKVRPTNQDHFLVCTVHPQVVIHGASLPDQEHLPLRGTRLATILLVADGVGRGGGGAEASRLAAEAVTRYVSSSLRCYHAAGSSSEEEFTTALRTAALEAHDAVRAEAIAQHEGRGMATTLTMAFAVWPWLYVVQVGDSRAYYYANGILTQVTRDQTMAQDLVDRGALAAEHLATSPLSHVLASSIGGEEASPVVSRIDITPPGCVVVLCSDGLTKHVSDEEIRERIATMESSEQLCRGLCQLALDRGGSDNVTVLAGRARPGARTGA